MADLFELTLIEVSSNFQQTYSEFWGMGLVLRDASMKASGIEKMTEAFIFILCQAHILSSIIQEGYSKMLRTCY
jgi:hypothetical protein